MALFKSMSQIVDGILTTLRVIQPDMDTKLGSVTRDLVDPIAAEISIEYADLRTASALTTLSQLSGVALERYLSNYDIVRESAQYATGVCYLTRDDLGENDVINISQGQIITTVSGGASYQVVGSYIMSGTALSVYRATALQIQDHLDTLNISDKYAIAVVVRAMGSGTDYNRGAYSLRTMDISGIDNCLNVNSIGGGTDVESDESLKSRGTLIWTGNDVGTTSGYRRVVLTHVSLTDALLAGPGSVHMKRDGTEFDDDGIIVTEGSGGKVDIWVLGSKLLSHVEGFTYEDQSGLADPTNADNNHRIGHVNVLPEDQPYQPASSIVSLIGTYGNETNVYILGQNFELLKDIEQTIPSNYAGSSQGYDKIHWLRDYISILAEEITKGEYHSLDGLAHTGVRETSDVFEEISVVAENAISDGTWTIQTKHIPILTPTRVFNLSTNEDYQISSYDSALGQITLSGIKAPLATDFLQTNYTWKRSFDALTEYSYDETENAIDWSHGGKLTANNHPILFLDTVELGSSVATNVLAEIQYLQQGANWDSADPWKITLNNSVVSAVSSVSNYSADIVEEKITDSIAGGVSVPLIHPEISNHIGSGLGDIGRSSVQVHTYKERVVSAAVEAASNTFTLPSYVTNEALAVSNQKGTSQGAYVELPTQNTNYHDSSVFFFRNTFTLGLFPWRDGGQATHLAVYSLRDDTKNWTSNSLVGGWLVPNRNVMDFRYKIIRNTSAEIFVVQDPDSRVTDHAAMAGGIGPNYLISFVEIAWDALSTPASLQYMVDYDTGQIRLPSGTTVDLADGVLVDYRYYMALDKDTAEKEWAATLAANEYSVNYTEGRIKFGVETRGHRVSYQYKEDYVLTNAQVPGSGNSLGSNQIELDLAANNALHTPLSNDWLRVNYTYTVFASKELTETSPFIIPTHLRVNISGTTLGTGSVTISGTTATAVENESIVHDSGQNVITVFGDPEIPGGFIGSVLRVYNVTQDVTYDLRQYYLNNNTYDRATTNDGYGAFDEFYAYYDGYGGPLTAYQLMLDSTLNPVPPSATDVLQVDYLWAKENDSEQLRYSAFGEQVTQKRFWLVEDKANTPPGIEHEGFVNEGGSVPTIKVESYNQPGIYKPDGVITDEAKYSVSYDYDGPRESEALELTYLYNSAIGEAQVIMENSRPITADILVKEAQRALIDVTFTITILTGHRPETVKTAVDAVVVNLLSASTLGGEIQSSDIVTAVGVVVGVNSVVIQKMARRGSTGTEPIELGPLEYFYPGIVLSTIGG